MRYGNTGVLVHDDRRATPGYTLFAPLAGRAAYLVGMRGEVVHQWSFPLTPGDIVRLLPGGNLLWTGRLEEDATLDGADRSPFEGGEGPPLRGGRGGAMREYDWDGRVVWEHTDPGQHHDCRRLANGHTVYLGWEAMPPEAARRVRGGIAGTERNGAIFGDYLREVSPDGRVVWEWHAHSDMELENYPLCPRCFRNEFAHANACAPVPDDGIMLSFRRINLVAIVDRATRRFRWEKRDDSWGHQHDCEMLANGNIQLFANGIHDSANPASRVVELDPATGETVWEYRGAPPHTFFSPHISGAQRLASGNTLICEGQWGRIFEVTPAGEIVWEYVSPFFAPFEGGGVANMVFRAYRYAADSPEIGGRLPAP